MTKHPRSEIVQKAQLKIQQSLTECAEGLTFAEVMHILASITSGWASDEVRYERNPTGTD